ncbi:hypothetical protein ALI22I_06590 [Saccharothrix sp. ALI-22-I]|uniref:RICIN domain-containing protein n=1 Tax=Saccharothrix sp. ALI-22-I TaxID=1933778 RepID=UPI00097C3C67|nr:RICIN domain-containing protein [Saccharothrix sp. ALI-22-I]ONI91924.1 hypothetical protein ALI22I_06590 [Saccharothrix sp. ALI-22-I]
MLGADVPGHVRIVGVDALALEEAVDAAMMRSAGIRMVRLGHLAWDTFEPSDGEFRFDWFDEVMDLMQDNGIGVILDVAVRPAPLWLHRKHPSIDITDANGNRLYANHRYMEDVGAPWTVASGPGGTYVLTYTASGEVLDVPGHSSTTGVQLTQWSTTGGANQQWHLRPNSDGYFTIVSRENGLAADVNAWSTDDGAKVVQWTAGGGANQQWQLIPA